MDIPICDLLNYDKNLRKVKEAQKVINNALIEQREKELYFAEKGYFPEEYPEGSIGYLQWIYPKTKESKAYVKEYTEANPTSTAKRPSRSRKKKEPAAKKPSEQWKPPPH